MFTLLGIYIAQMIACGIVHIGRDNRGARDLEEFLEMTFLPLVIINWNKYGK